LLDLYKVFFQRCVEFSIGKESEFNDIRALSRRAISEGQVSSRLLHLCSMLNLKSSGSKSRQGEEARQGNDMAWMESCMVKAVGGKVLA
jgi:hypothetical protein